MLTTTKKSFGYLLTIWLISLLAETLFGYMNTGRIIWYALGIFSLCLGTVLVSNNSRSEFNHIGLLHFALFVCGYSAITGELPFGFLNQYLVILFDSYPILFMTLMVIAVPVIFITLKYTYYRQTYNKFINTSKNNQD